MEMNGLMGGLYRISEWIMRFSVTNVLWVICSAPLFYLGLVLLMSETVEQVFSIFILMAVLSPFLFFPATAAMFSVARKWVMGDVDVPLIKTFFRSYKENYVQSMLGGILYTVLGALMVINYRFYLTQSGGFQFLSFVFILLSVILAISVFHYFSILAHLHMKTLHILKNALVITIGRPLTSLMIAATNAFIIYISTRFTFLIPFFMGSLIAYMSFFHFHRMFTKVMAKQQEWLERQAQQEGAGDGTEGGASASSERKAAERDEEPELSDGGAGRKDP
jgi:uncharacterized membrane protein YesL